MLRNKKSLILIVGVVFLLAISKFSNPKPESYQTDSIWETLKQVRIVKILDTKTLKFNTQAQFSDSILKLDNTEQTIKGFKTIDEHHADIYLITSHPNDVCAFCGEGGEHTFLKVTFNNQDSVKFAALDNRTYLEIRGFMKVQQPDGHNMYSIHNAQIIRIID